MPKGYTAAGKAIGKGGKGRHGAANSGGGRGRQTSTGGKVPRKGSGGGPGGSK